MYQGLIDCDTLEELKFFFNEFSGVKDAKELDYNKNSFIDKFYKGEIKTKDGKQFLNPDKDLALQLIQAYYLDCLSISDLTEELGINPYGVMLKLNIPLFSREYGSYLKLSDEEKNKSITDAISRNRTINESGLKRKGKPLTQEHREKISKSLIEYYKNNPRIGFLRTSEDDEYFTKNPIQDEIFSIVLTRAWNYPEGKSIRKKMSKFFRKDISAEDALNMTRQKSKRKDMEDFWRKYAFLKEKWSEALKKSWNTQKNYIKVGVMYDPIFETEIQPLGIIKHIFDDHDAFVNEPVFILISNFTVFNKNDRENLRKKSENGIEYYNTSIRSYLCETFKQNPEIEKIAKVYYASIFDLFKSAFTVIYKPQTDKSRASIMHIKYNPTIDAYEKINALISRCESKDTKNTSAIEYYDTLIKIIEILKDYNCTELIDFINWIDKIFYENKKIDKNIIKKSIQEYKRLCTIHPNLKID